MALPTNPTEMPCWCFARSSHCAICGGERRLLSGRLWWNRSMAKRVLLECRDLFFRGKVQAILAAAGAEIVRDDPIDLAVLELGKPGVDERIQNLVRRGVPVLAFGSHVDAAALRAARELGARAVPNSQIESELRALL